KFRLGLMSKSAQQIIANYDWILDDCKSVTAQERDILQTAKDFIQAYHRGDDQAIIAAWETIQKKSYQKFFIFTAEDQQRIKLTRRRKAALLKFRLSIISNRNIQHIVAAYDPVLDDCKNLTQGECEQLDLAQGFVQAYQSGDDQAILSAWSAI